MSDEPMPNDAAQPEPMPDDQPPDGGGPRPASTIFYLRGEIIQLEDERPPQVIEVNVEVGQILRIDDTVVTLDFYKAVVEIPIPFACTVTEVFVRPDCAVDPGTALIRSEVDGTAAFVARRHEMSGTQTGLRHLAELKARDDCRHVPGLANFLSELVRIARMFRSTSLDTIPSALVKEIRESVSGVAEIPRQIRELKLIGKEDLQEQVLEVQRFVDNEGAERTLRFLRAFSLATFWNQTYGQIRVDESSPALIQ